MLGQDFFRDNRSPLERVALARRRLDKLEIEYQAAQEAFASACDELAAFDSRTWNQPQT